MKNSINKTILVGRTGKDPVIRTMNNGSKVANFPLATSESWIDKTKNERREKTEWHNIVIYGDGLASIAEKFVRKGSRLYIEGAIQTRKWVDVENNQRTTMEIVLQGFNSTLVILNKVTSEDGNNAAEDDDEVPF
ncbi:single-stranded DNA binding protein [Abalone shriveling syndrome-associated virus]|uniref:single-stranded DNA binding protein n=1 Tax=Abalone shriveling syndrome-associated virus TaxID=491893 RepID=UPI0001881BB8|nr:single-stranded DNA binding protein [Abalone shriveling syndrome-associated virus]ACJ71993.1 single-stranded DNA binding protein [Abalone shriveling syndrome-associated virus]